MNKNYYEQKELWDRELTPQEIERIDIVKKYIPDNVETLLDAGCGNGAISNYLEGFDITAMDRSKEALQYVKNEAILGSLDNLPFEDNSFDMIMCSDVLEHLPDDVYKKTIKEFKRVSKKYILIISPNSEDLEANQSKCIKCGTVFHMNWHIRSISIDDIVNSFRDDFSPVYYSYFGEKWASEPELKYTLARTTNRGYKYWENAVCPMCNTQQKNQIENTKDIDVQCNRLLNGFANKSTEFIVLLSNIENKKKIFDFDDIQDKQVILSKKEITKLEYVNRQSVLVNNDIFTKTHTEFYPQYGYIIDDKENEKKYAHKIFVLPYIQNSTKLNINYIDSTKTSVNINIYTLKKGYIYLDSMEFLGDNIEKTITFDIPLVDIIPANEGLIFEIVFEDKTISFEELKFKQIYMDNNFSEISLDSKTKVKFLDFDCYMYEYDLLLKEGQFLLIGKNSCIYDKELKCFYMNLKDSYEFFDAKSKNKKEELTQIKEELTQQSQTSKQEIDSIKEELTQQSQTSKQEIDSIKEELTQQSQTSKQEIDSIKEEIVKLQKELYSTKQNVYTVSNTLESFIYKIKNPIKTLFKSKKQDEVEVIQSNSRLKHLVVITPDVRVDRRTVQMCQSLIEKYNIRCTIIAALEEKDDFVTDKLKVKRVDPYKSKKYVLKPDDWRDDTGVNLEEFYWLHPHYLHSAMEEDADYIMCCDLPVLPTAVYVAKNKNIPLIYDAHELYPEQAIFEDEKREFYTKVETEFIEYPNLVITVNISIAKEMAKRYNIKEPEVILNALDASSSFDINKKYDYFRKKLSIKPSQKIVLFQGGYSSNRNLHLFVESAKYINNKDVVLVLMGFGDYEKELQQIAKDNKTLNKNVFFFPAVDQSVLLEYSASADVGIIPYPHIDLNSYYCTPNKLFEFIQAGLPMIANDSPELNRFVKENSIGYSKKIENEKDIADMIDTYFEQGVDYKKNILKVRDKISWSVEESKFVEMMKGIIQ